MPDNSIDAVVTDPPYGLAFMGKRWDYDVPSEEIWRECLRVLKPGGHLLAFAGTRTQHRMAVRIEDAGFEIRDMIAWVYGSGFPKSLDVSKAIDKGHGENRERQLQFTAWMRSTGITARQIDDITASKMGNHYTTHPTQPAIATADMFDKLRPYLPKVPEYIERLVCERTGLEWTAYKNREVVGQRRDNGGRTVPYLAANNNRGHEFNITAPATPEAQQWQGWGTALKPALEPITVARKPLIGTVAENVLTWGTGGVNVDGCRVEGKPPSVPQPRLGVRERITYGFGTGEGRNGAMSDASGRWPANLIHDGSEEVVRLFPETGPSKAADRGLRHSSRHGGLADSGANIKQGTNGVRGHDDVGGSAARFFYCAKASKADRGEGNAHPTVKPTDLMRYLCRLVTPPGGVVLDPFTGSGSTGKAAILEGFRFVGIEREAEYLSIAHARIHQAHQQINKQPRLLP